MTWIFDGVVLPDGDEGRLVAEGGPDPEPHRLPGRYALPGLVDAHAHLTVRTDTVSLGDEAWAADRLQEYADGGVTLVRDVGGRSSVTLPLTQGTGPGLPAVLAAGRFLAPEGRYFPGLFDPVPADGLRRAATAELERGATWLKVIADSPQITDGVPVPGTVTPTYDIESVRELVELAHDHGARVAVHTQSAHVAALVEVGVDSVEHGEWLDEDAVRALGARSGAWTPTLGAITDPPGSAPERRQRYAAEASERLRVLLPLALACGVRVLAGTDTAATLPREVALLARHGLDPAEALRAASTAAREWLAPGLPASGSLVTYADDPREDPEVLERPVAVVVRGERVR